MTEKKKGKKDKKKKGKKHHDRHGDTIVNARGETVPVAQYALEQTLDATNRSLRHCRERMESLIGTNESLQDACTQQEKDALDVIAALHAESERKDSQIKALQDEMKRVVEQSKVDQQRVVYECDLKLQEMNSAINEKEATFKIMQSEFAVIKDFRKKRQDLLKELDYLKQELADTERQHKETISRMERKFFEEKIRLQKEANRKISELAAKAHKEAVANLKETTKEVYKENMRLSESLSYHVQEGEELAKQNKELLRANRLLIEEKDLHNVIVKEKILQAKTQSQETKDLYAKVQSMEHALSHVVREFEHERGLIGKLARKELDEVRKVAERLRENLERKAVEMKHIKRLAQHILDQRTDLERFLMDSLDHVRHKIQLEREESKRVAREEYNRRIRAVMANKAVPFSTIQSFKPNLLPALPTTVPPQTAVPAAESTGPADSPEPASTKLTHPTPPPVPPAASPSDYNRHHRPRPQSRAASEGGERPPPLPPPPPQNSGKRLDISELSWTDKERVLRLLFAKMNGVALVGAERQAAGKGAAALSTRKGAAALAEGDQRGQQPSVGGSDSGPGHVESSGGADAGEVGPPADAWVEGVNVEGENQRDGLTFQQGDFDVGTGGTMDSVLVQEVADQEQDYPEESPGIPLREAMGHSRRESVLPPIMDGSSGSLASLHQ